MGKVAKQYYWLKLQKDFFKRHDIRIIESMPNGKDYILFYLKLLCESISHEGGLRFSDTIPYNETMLSTITNTNIDLVRNAISVFKELKMIEVLDDGTYYMREVKKMIGVETEWAKKKREYRENKRLAEDKEKTLIGQNEDNVLKSETTVETMSLDSGQNEDNVLKNRTKSDKSKSKSIELEYRVRDRVRNKEEEEEEINKEEIEEIYAFMNKKLSSSFLPDDETVLSYINQLFKKGYQVDDFKKVVSNCYDSWNGTQESQYLKPFVMFNPKYFNVNLNMRPKEKLRCMMTKEELEEVRRKEREETEEQEAVTISDYKWWEEI